MTGSDATILLIVCVLSLLGAGALHAIVAAFEQLPWADERRLAAAVRPDGKPTAAARLSAAPGDTDNSASVAYATLEAVGLVCWTLFVVGIGIELDWSPWIFGTIAAGTAAFLSLMVVRALPRQLGRSYPEATVRGTAPIARMLIVITTPVRAVVPALRAPALAEPEDLVDRAHEALEEEDVELVRGVVNLGDTLTREVMVPRTDMITIRAGTSMRKALSLFLRSGFSRVPVVAEDADDIVGVVYFKDVVRASTEESKRLDDAIDGVMREPEFVPESLAVDDLLRRMQDDVFHMAIVVDEYGGVAGLVTIEDALEEIVGELVDEHDAAEPEAEPLMGGGFRVPARMALDDLGELFDVEIEDDDVDTVAGLLSKALGRVPIPGAGAVAHGLVLTADKFEGRRRRLSSVIVKAQEEDDE